MDRLDTFLESIMNEWIKGDETSRKEVQERIPGARKRHQRATAKARKDEYGDIEKLDPKERAQLHLDTPEAKKKRRDAQKNIKRDGKFEIIVEDPNERTIDPDTFFGKQNNITFLLVRDEFFYAKYNGNLKDKNNLSRYSSLKNKKNVMHFPMLWILAHTGTLDYLKPELEIDEFSNNEVMAITEFSSLYDVILGRYQDGIVALWSSEDKSTINKINKHIEKITGDTVEKVYIISEKAPRRDQSLKDDSDRPGNLEAIKPEMNLLDVIRKGNLAAREKGGRQFDSDDSDDIWGKLLGESVGDSYDFAYEGGNQYTQYYSFENRIGQTIDVNFLCISEKNVMDKDNLSDMTFTSDDGDVRTMTGSGDAIQVLSTVAKIILDHIDRKAEKNKVDPEEIRVKYSGVDEHGRRNPNSKRSRVYKKIFSKVIQDKYPTMTINQDDKDFIIEKE